MRKDNVGVLSRTCRRGSQLPWVLVLHTERRTLKQKGPEGCGGSHGVPAASPRRSAVLGGGRAHCHPMRDCLAWDSSQGSCGGQGGGRRCSLGGSLQPPTPCVLGGLRGVPLLRQTHASVDSARSLGRCGGLPDTALCVSLLPDRKQQDRSQRDA